MLSSNIYLSNRNKAIEILHYFINTLYKYKYRYSPMITTLQAPTACALPNPDVDKLKHEIKAKHTTTKIFKKIMLVSLICIQPQWDQNINS